MQAAWIVQTNHARPLAWSGRNTGIRKPNAPLVLKIGMDITFAVSFVMLPFSLLVYIGVGVAAGIILILVVLVVAYFVMKSKK